MKSPPVVFSISWNACINCGVCVAICPQEAGFISDFDTIAVQTPCDIACMICEQICPVDAITHVKTFAAPGLKSNTESKRDAVLTRPPVSTQP